MNIPQNLPINLPFWDALHKQTARHSYCRGLKELIAIPCRYDRLLSWTIEQTPEAGADYVYLVEEDGLTALDITSLLLLQSDTVDGIGYTHFDSDFDIVQDDDVPVYPRDSVDDPWGSSAHSDEYESWVCSGSYYYLEVKIGDSIWHSELMHLVDFPEFAEQSDSPDNTRVRFEVLANCTVAGVPTISINNPLIYFCNARAARPEYKIDKTVAKDGDEDEATIWAKIVKRYVVEFYAPESVADFFATLPLYSTVNFTDQYGLQSNVTDVEVKISWNEEGNDCAALIEVSFKRDFVTNSECC